MWILQNITTPTTRVATASHPLPYLLCVDTTEHHHTTTWSGYCSLTHSHTSCVWILQNITTPTTWSGYCHLTHSHTSCVWILQNITTPPHGVATVASPTPIPPVCGYYRTSPHPPHGVATAASPTPIPPVCGYYRTSPHPPHGVATAASPTPIPPVCGYYRTSPHHHMEWLLQPHPLPYLHSPRGLSWFTQHCLPSLHLPLLLLLPLPLPLPPPSSPPQAHLTWLGAVAIGTTSEPSDLLQEYRATTTCTQSHTTPHHLIHHIT